MTKGTMNKRLEVSRKRWIQARALHDTGLFSKEQIAELLGVTGSLIHHYLKHDTFEAYHAYNQEKSKERVAKRKSQQAVALAEKALEQELSRTEETPREDDAPETTESEAVETYVYDPMARKLIAEIEQRLADITERLSWVESNAVIDTTHKNRIQWFGRGR